MEKNKKIVAIFMLLVSVFTLFSFSTLYAEDSKDDVITYDNGLLSNEEVTERLNSLQTDNALEYTLSGFALDLGDMIIDFITFFFNDEITIDRLVFNRISSLDANFFKYNKMSLIPRMTKVLCSMINNWYFVFRGIAIIAYLMVLTIIGIRIMLATPGAKADAKMLLSKWTIGVAILVLFPYVMKYAFNINDAILAEIRKTFTNNNPYDEIIGSYIGGASSVQYDKVFELRSPEYVSRTDYFYTIGSEEATMAYFKQLQKYKERGDLMRIMRALAGITGRFIYVILWFIMLFQMIVLLYIYIKRYLMIAFLIIIFPLAVAEYLLGTVRPGKGGAFNAWCVEFFVNVFLQTIHAMIYGMIGGVVMAQVQNGVVTGDIEKMNWIIMIVSVNFLFEGEKIIKNIMKANSAVSVASSENVARGMKGAGGKVVGAGGKIKGFFGKKKD